MLDIIKKHSGSVILSVVFMLVGAIFGFWFDADDQGIYLSANYPGGNNAFTVGQKVLNLQDLNLQALDEPAAQLVASGIASLQPAHHLSKQLWNMAQKGQGPFQTEQVTIKLILSDQLDGPIGAACRRSPILGKSVVAFAIDEPGELVVGTRGILGIQVLMPEEFSPECNNSPESNIAMWINRGLVESWLGRTLEGRLSLSVKAKMVLTNAISTASATVAHL